MTRSASAALEFRMNVTALLVIGSILWFGVDIVEVISGQPQFRVGLVIAVPHAGRVCRVEKDPRIDSADVAVAKEHVVRPAMPRWVKGRAVDGTQPGQAAFQQIVPSRRVVDLRTQES